MDAWQGEGKLVKTGKLSLPDEQLESGRQQSLEVIRSADHIARIDIAKATDSSPATVTTVTAELLNAGVIEQAAKAEDQSSKDAITAER